MKQIHLTFHNGEKETYGFTDLRVSESEVSIFREGRHTITFDREDIQRADIQFDELAQ